MLRDVCYILGSSVPSQRVGETHVPKWDRRARRCSHSLMSSSAAAPGPQRKSRRRKRERPPAEIPTSLPDEVDGIKLQARAVHQLCGARPFRESRPASSVEVEVEVGHRVFIGEERIHLLLVRVGRGLRGARLVVGRGQGSFEGAK